MKEIKKVHNQNVGAPLFEIKLASEKTKNLAKLKKVQEKYKPYKK